MKSFRNLIIFKGTKEALDGVIAFFKEGHECELNFSKVIPLPEGLRFSDFDHFEGVALGEFMIDHTTKLMNKDLREWSDLEKDIHVVRDSIKDRVHRVLHMGGSLSDEELLTALKEYYEREMPWVLKDAKMEYENYKKYGYGTLQEWAATHWGTPSNTFCARSLSSMKPKYDDEKQCYVMSYSFKTMSSTPDLVYRAMVKKFPDVKMTFEFAENKNGKNAGNMVVLENGVMMASHYPNSSEKAMEIAKRVFSH